METINQTEQFKRFKFKELKTYSSTEWLIDNKKKYRQVFDQMEVGYIYVELSFYNKFFDEDEWDANITLICNEAGTKPKNICRLDFTRRISRLDPVVFIREGWGNKKEGSFWKKGSYYWEAYIDGELVGTRHFFIEDSGAKRFDYSNYIELAAVRLYEGQYDDYAEGEKVFYQKFSSANTRYIFTEILLKNKLRSKEWRCEFFVKYFNHTGELKAHVVRLNHVSRNQDEILVTAGFGSNTPGTWTRGMYRLELTFMDTLIGIVNFEVGDEFEEGILPIKLPNQNQSLTLPNYKINSPSYQELLKKLNAFIGLAEIKKQIEDHANYIHFLQIRKLKGFKEHCGINIHSVFVGNPGTGKTTIARMMGVFYHHMGILSKGHIYEVDRSDLVGEYIGQTAPKVKDAIEKARGGVLFIDEAYALARSGDDNKDFGREVIEILIKEMSNGKGDIAIIVAGYPKEMKKFIDSNPGLKSRFGNFFNFPDYTPQELAEIAKYACNEKEVELSEDAEKKLNQIIQEAYRNRDSSFGNARFVFDIIEKSKVNLGLRVMKYAKPESKSIKVLKTITAKDIASPSQLVSPKVVNLQIDQELLESSLAELNSLTGIHHIKKEIYELTELVRYYKLTNRNVLSSFSLHTVLVGNPGTGKTTVARIMAKIYKALGLLERGHMVETDRQGLIAGFIGQTAIKTSERIDEAMGGVLFVDEAYALSNFNGLQGDYGNESIQTILKRMEDDRGKFFVFVAGYPGNMETFLKANPGFSSRFDKILHFNDYNPDELFHIAESMLAKENLALSPQSSQELNDILRNIYIQRDKFFGNARAVRTIVQEISRNFMLRASAMEGSSKNYKNIILPVDLQNLSCFSGSKVFEQKRIGYQKSF